MKPQLIEIFSMAEYDAKDCVVCAQPAYPLQNFRFTLEGQPICEACSYQAGYTISREVLGRMIRAYARRRQ